MGKSFFLFLNQTISFGYSEEPSRLDGSFEHPNHMLKFMIKIVTILGEKSLTGTMNLDNIAI